MYLFLIILTVNSLKHGSTQNVKSQNVTDLSSESIVYKFVFYYRYQLYYTLPYVDINKNIPRKSFPRNSHVDFNPDNEEKIKQHLPTMESYTPQPDINMYQESNQHLFTTESNSREFDPKVQETAINQNCEDNLVHKVEQTIDTKLTRKIILPNYDMGSLIKLQLERGSLDIDHIILLGEPACTKDDYSFIGELRELSGTYDWSLSNFFAHNLSESAIIMIEKIDAEFNFKNDVLEHLKLGQIDGIRVDVNMPESAMEVFSDKFPAKFIASRITTIVTNHIKIALQENLEASILRDSKNIGKTGQN